MKEPPKAQNFCERIRGAHSSSDRMLTTRYLNHFHDMMLGLIRARESADQKNVFEPMDSPEGPMVLVHRSEIKATAYRNFLMILGYDPTLERELKSGTLPIFTGPFDLPPERLLDVTQRLNDLQQETERMLADAQEHGDPQNSEVIFGKNFAAFATPIQGELLASLPFTLTESPREDNSGELTVRQLNAVHKRILELIVTHTTHDHEIILTPEYLRSHTDDLHISPVKAQAYAAFGNIFCHAPGLEAELVSGNIPVIDDDPVFGPFPETVAELYTALEELTGVQDDELVNIPHLTTVGSTNFQNKAQHELTKAVALQILDELPSLLGQAVERKTYANDNTPNTAYGR